MLHSSIFVKFYPLLRGGLKSGFHQYNENGGGLISGMKMRYSIFSGKISKEMILQASSTPLHSPSYPRGPYLFQNREYFIVLYESDPKAIRKVVPAPLLPQSNIVAYEWIKMPDSTGFGNYQESGTVIPCEFKGKPVNFTTQMFLNDEPPIAAGREIWGFPKKRADPEFGVIQDTIYGRLNYNGQQAAWGTMNYKYKEIPEDTAIKSLTKTSVNLKIIPDVDFKPKIVELVEYNLILKRLIGAWEGSARLHLIPHANAPTADLPVKRVVQGVHYIADILLPYGKVLYDYLAPENQKNGNGSLSNWEGNNIDDKEDIFSEEKVRNTQCMPPISPSYSPSPFNFRDREYFIIIYKTNPNILRENVPDLLEINASGHVIVQWIFTKSFGIGTYSKLEVKIPVTDRNGKSYLYSLNEFTDSSAAITFGREVYGYPSKYGHPELSVHQDTIIGKFSYSGVDVAYGTMPFKELELDEQVALNYFKTPRLNLKLIPDATGAPAIAQLVSINYTNIEILSAFQGRARLHLIPHCNAPISDYPVNEIIGAYNIVCNLTMQNGKVEHDYLKQE